MYTQPKPNAIANKITYRPSHVPNNYSPSNSTNKSRPNFAAPPASMVQNHRLYNNGVLQQPQFNTQPINGPRLYTNGSSNNSRRSLVSRGTPSSNSLSERNAPTFGKYKLIREIGKGNFAKVKLAQHLVTGKEVAVKIIDKTKLNSSALQKLTREVKIMKELNHPNIVRLFEVIQTERSLYLVMEYAPNGEVFEHLVKHGRLKEKDARAKFRQILSAVQYCHQKMIIHRDLKAENLLLDKDMNIKIADFGFSNHYSPQSKLNTFCGSPPYAAPELFQGRRYEGPEVDVWSLGVIMYTLISGSLPFDGGTLKELRERVLRGKYRIPFYMSSDSETLLRKMLVLNPQKRLPLHEIMKDTWVNICYEDDILKPYVEPAIDYNDQAKIDALMNMGFTRQQIMDALQQKQYDSITAIYLLWDPSVPKLSGIKPTNFNSNSLRIAPTSIAVSSTVPETSYINKTQLGHDNQRDTSYPSRNISHFFRKTNINTVTSSIDDDPVTQGNIDKQGSSSCSSSGSGSSVPAPYDFTQSSGQRNPTDTGSVNKPRPQPHKMVPPSTFSDVTITGESTDLTNNNSRSFDIDIDNLKPPEKFSDVSENAKTAIKNVVEGDNLTETEVSSSDKLIETSIDDIDVPPVLPYSASTAPNRQVGHVRRNPTFSDYPSSKPTANIPARKGYSGQDGQVYAIQTNQLIDKSKINTVFTSSPHNLLNANSGGYDQDSFNTTHHPTRTHRSNTGSTRTNNNPFKQLSIPEPMGKLSEEPDDNLVDNDVAPHEPITFKRSVNGYQSLRLPSMIPPYQAYTSSQCYTKYPKKEEAVPSAGTREQSPFSRNTPERATIQYVPHNTRERIELEKAVLSGVGGPSGPSNLPTALVGSINHPQPPKNDKSSSQLKKSSDEYLNENVTGTKTKKKSAVNSFLRSLTTKITKKKLSNASPSMNRSPSQTETLPARHGSIQRSQTNQFQYGDNKDKWSNYPTELYQQKPLPYFQDRSAQPGYANKASHFDTDNLITNSSATSPTSSASSFTTHSNRTQTKPRILRFSFRTQVTSKKSADELMAEIKRVLVAFHIDYEQKFGYLLMCTFGESNDEVAIHWEVEVVRLSSKSINGIRFKRLQGPRLKFKEISKRITERLQL